MGTVYEDLKVAAQNMDHLLPEELQTQDHVYAFRAMAALKGVVLCGRCEGRGVLSAPGVISDCPRCRGLGYPVSVGYRPQMKMRNDTTVNVTDYGKLLERFVKKAQALKRTDDRRVARALEAAAAQEAVIKAKQSETLSKLNDEQRSVFLNLVRGKKFTDPNTGNTLNKFANDFVASISMQFQRYGNLSDKQISAILWQAEKIAKKEKARERYVDYSRDERVEIFGKVQSIQEVAVMNITYYSTTWTNKINVRTENGQNFVIKTTSKKLLSVFNEALESKKDVRVDSKVTWVSPEKTTVCLSSKGMKLSLTQD